MKEPSDSDKAGSLASEQTAEEGPRQVAIKSDGDVILVCNDRSLQVSSVILSHASDVFKRLFQPGFKEGNRERSAEHPLLLNLPEDDGVAMELLVGVLHFRSDWTTAENRSIRSMNPDGMAKLVSLADKYLCTNVLYFTCDSEIGWWISIADIADLDCLTRVAYLTGNERKFQLLTAHILDNFPPDQLSCISSSCLKAILQEIRLAQAFVRQRLLRAVEKSIDQLQDAAEKVHSGIYGDCLSDPRAALHKKRLDTCGLRIEDIKMAKNPELDDYAAFYYKATLEEQCDCGELEPGCPLRRITTRLKNEIEFTADLSAKSRGVKLADFKAALVEIKKDW